MGLRELHERDCSVMKPTCPLGVAVCLFHDVTSDLKKLKNKNIRQGKHDFVSLLGR